jgi:hypothetical protein
VRAVISRKPGPAASVLVHLPDVTAPVGAFHSSWTGSDATITQDSLSDDSGGPVSRSVDWGDASPAEAWTTGTTLNHHYAGLGRFVPTVTLQDASSNTTVLTLDAIVIGDTTAPTGTFTVSPGTAWAKLTKVTVTQTSLGDDFSPVANITRTVEWGDGTTSSDWTPAGTISHVYATASSPSYTPQVTLTDEAHNSTAPIVTSAVVVTADTVAPVVRLLLPRAKHSVKAWTTLRGKATDTNGTGVKVVSLRAVEKRGTAWYGYQATTKRWVKAATMAKAFARSRALSLHTSSTNVWAGKLAGLRKGTLVYKVKATDNVGNASAVLTHKASLTRR